MGRSFPTARARPHAKARPAAMVCARGSSRRGTSLLGAISDGPANRRETVAFVDALAALLQAAASFPPSLRPGGYRSRVNERRDRSTRTRSSASAQADDRMRGVAIMPTGAVARSFAVECDHAASGGGVIAFLTKRSSGSGAPGASSWANPLVRDRAVRARFRARASSPIQLPDSLRRGDGSDRPTVHGSPVVA